MLSRYIGLTLDSCAAMLPGVTALGVLSDPCGRRTLWPPMVAIALFGTCDLQLCLISESGDPGAVGTHLDSAWPERRVVEKISKLCDGGRLGQYAHGRSGKERARRMMVFFDIGRRAVEGQWSECRASKLGRLARTGG